MTQLQQPVTVADLLAARGSRMVVLNTSRDVNAKLSVLLAPPGSDELSIVLKVPTTAVAAVAVATEGRVLADLHRSGIGCVAGTVPRLLGEYDAGGLAAIATTALPGEPMRTGYHRWLHTARPAQVRRDFALAGSWLARFQRESAGAPAPVRLLADGLAGLDRRWPDDPRVAEIRARLAGPGALLGRAGAPRTAVHGDYWHGNILIGRDAVSGVVDWECGTLSGEPLRDVARFPLGYATYLDRHTPPGWPVPGHRGLVAGPFGAGVEHALFSTGWFGRLVREFVSDGLSRLGVPAGLWRTVLLAGLAEVAAGADHPDFAEQNLELLLRSVRRAADGGPPG